MAAIIVVTGLGIVRAAQRGAAYTTHTAAAYMAVTAARPGTEDGPSLVASTITGWEYFILYETVFSAAAGSRWLGQHGAFQ